MEGRGKEGGREWAERAPEQFSVPFLFGLSPPLSPLTESEEEEGRREEYSTRTVDPKGGRGSERKKIINGGAIRSYYQ